MLVDTREPDQNILLRLDAVCGTLVRRTCLEAADFAIFDHNGCSIGIERKTVSDLLNSVRSGRLDQQLARMATCYDVSVLLIEGLLNMGEGGKIVAGSRQSAFSHAAIQAYLWRVQADGVRLMTTAGAQETVDALRILEQRGRLKCLVTNAALVRRRGTE